MNTQFTDEQIKTTYEVLEEQLEKAERNVQILKEAISTLRGLCEHDFNLYIKQHNRDVYKCRFCGKTIKI